MQRSFFITATLAVTIGFSGCGSTGSDTGISNGDSSDALVQKQSRRVSVSHESVSDVQINGLEYLNRLRFNAGMTTYRLERSLNQSALNHASYVVDNNTFGHEERQDRRGFSGTYPYQRAINAGYNHQSVSENLSAGNEKVTTSIDALFSAIYHRFGFLDFKSNEIGIGFKGANSYKYSNAYVYNMGISQLRSLCQGNSFSGQGQYYTNVCSNVNFAIDGNRYLSAIKENKLRNPNIVVWPYENQTDSMDVFYEESPDPLPECSVSGYPVSIQFNDAKSGDIKLQSFKLFDADSKIQITDAKLLTAQNDPNRKFTKNQFALFPKKRLNFGKSYRAEVIYSENGVSKRKVWNFKTKTLPYRYFKVENGANSFNVQKNKTYLFYVTPRNCNDIIKTTSINFDPGINVTNSFYDLNTIQIKVTGASGKVTVHNSNGTSFTLNVN